MIMYVTMTSSISGRKATLNIDITEEQLDRVMNRRANGELIQNIVPHLSQSHREFLMSGITPQEWLSVFGERE